eukprot:9278350-Pyramimonas_sp.AAC.1
MLEVHGDGGGGAHAGGVAVARETARVDDRHVRRKCLPIWGSGGGQEGVRRGLGGVQERVRRPPGYTSTSQPLCSMIN